MLYMVVELFRPGMLEVLEERFKQHGRMLPEGVEYCGSWLEPDGSRCFQLMQADTRKGLDVWASRWSDLMEFEIAPVKTSQEFWADHVASKAS